MSKRDQEGTSKGGKTSGELPISAGELHCRLGREEADWGNWEEGKKKHLGGMLT